MDHASRPPWTRLVHAALAAALFLWLASSVIASGMASYYENGGEGGRALRWRPTAPAALAIKAAELMQRGDSAAAESMARQALLRSVLQADAFRTLALSAYSRQSVDTALTLMSRAGRLNPRDNQTQNWLFDQAMARGDYRRAVLHADALMRRSPQVWSPLSFMLATRLGDSTLRAGLVQRLSVDPPWRGTFIGIAARNGADDDIASLFQALKHTASPVTDAEAAAFFNRLVAEAKYQKAKQYFDALVSQPAGPPPLVYNGGFEGLPGPPPLNWQNNPGSGGSARWTLDDGSPLGSLRVSHDGFTSTATLVEQLLLLPPGQYRVSARSQVDDPAAADRFKLLIKCVGGSNLVLMTLQGSPGSWAQTQAGFEVPPAACEAQWLNIVPATSDRRDIAEMSIDDIVIRRVAIGSRQGQTSDRAP